MEVRAPPHLAGRARGVHRVSPRRTLAPVLLLGQRSADIVSLGTRRMGAFLILVVDHTAATLPSTEHPPAIQVDSTLRQT